MADGQDGGIDQHGLADNNTDIDTDLTDTAMGYAHLFDESVVLVHQQNPELLYVFIL